MMMTVFRKSTTRPWLSVSRPSSRICSRRLKTSGCAFSISSKRMTLYGRRRTASVSWPPSSYPTYPGGAPIIRATECFSMYSDMSSRTMRPLVVEQELGERARRLGLAHAGGAEEDERPGRAGWCPAARPGSAAPRWPPPPAPPRCPTTRWRSSSSRCVSRCAVGLQHLGDRNAGPLGHDLRDVLRVHFFLEVPGVLLHLVQPRLLRRELRLQLRECGHSAARPRAAGRPAAWPGPLRSAAPRPPACVACSSWMACFLRLPLRLHAGALLPQLRRFPARSSCGAPRPPCPFP